MQVFDEDHLQGVHFISPAVRTQMRSVQFRDADKIGWL